MKNIIILSAVKYDSMRQRPHHMARYYSQKDRTNVYYFSDVEQSYDKEEKYHLNALKEIKNNVHIMYYPYENEEDIQLANCINHICKGTVSIVIVAFPAFVGVVTRLDSHIKVVYDCIDDWEGFIHDLDFNWKIDLLYQERQLASISDLVTVSAKRLFAKMLPYNKNVVYLPNGAWLDDYKLVGGQTRPDDLPNSDKIVFFMGAIAEWVDTELISKLIEKRPNYDYVFVGPKVNNKLPNQDNVHFLGYKPYEELVNYLIASKVCIIPFVRTNLTACVTPLKIYEYLSAKKPVVTTYMPDLFTLEVVDVTFNIEQFIEAIDKYMNLPFEEYVKISEKARSSVIDYNWTNLLPKIENFFDNGISQSGLEVMRDTLNVMKDVEYNLEMLNELLLYSNISKDYRIIQSIPSFLQDLKVAKVIDWEQVALCFYNLGQKDLAVDYVLKYIAANEEKDYLKETLFLIKYEQELEAFLYQICQRYSESLGLLDSKSDSHITIRLITNALFSMNEKEIAMNFLFTKKELLPQEKFLSIFDQQLLIHVINYCILKRDFNEAKFFCTLLEDKYTVEVATPYFASIFLNQAAEVNDVQLKGKIGFFMESKFHYFLYESLIKRLILEGYECYFVVNDYYRHIENWSDTYKQLIELLYNLDINGIQIEQLSLIKQFDNKYDIVISPYYSEHLKGIARKNVRLVYGLMAKDEWNYSWWNVFYDKIMCYGEYDFKRLNHFGTSEVIGIPRFDSYFTMELDKLTISKRYNLDDSKKTILYAPTYGELSSIDEWGYIIDELQKEYNVIVKIHHGTASLKSEEGRRTFLNKNFSIVSDCSEELLSFIMVADYVLTDYSGVIFDVLLLKKKIILLNNSNDTKIEGISHDNSKEKQLRSVLPNVSTKKLLSSVLKNESVFSKYDNEVDKILQEAGVPFDGNATERAFKSIKFLLKENSLEQDYLLQDLREKLFN